MSQRPLKIVSSSSADRENKPRLTLKAFFSLLCPHIEAIELAQEALKEHAYQFTFGNCVMFDECEDTIDYLVDLSVIYRQFQGIIKRSDALPLAIVPIRLMLLTALLDANAQVTKLKELLMAFSETSSTSLFQSPKQVHEIECELSALQKQNDHLLDQIRVFTDNARFKEREYSMA